MKIWNVTDPEFAGYGRVLTEVDVSGLTQELKKIPAPDGVIYEPSVARLEALPEKKRLSEIVYGEMPVQIGYCCGHNRKLNALEYHRDSEINVAATDAVLLLGRLEDVEADYTYDTAKVEAFFVPAGTAVEVYAITLHYAPCHTADGGFRMGIVLPAGTNYPLKTEHARVSGGRAAGEDSLLAAVNKWLIGHPEGGLDEGCFPGLKGRNVSLDD